MRLLSIIFFVVMCVIIDKVTGAEIKVFAKQVKTKIFPGQNLLSAKTPITDGDNIIWHKSFATDVLFFGGEAQYNEGNIVKTVKLDWNEGIDICEEVDDGSLFDLAGQLLRKSWLPLGSCPVNKGSFKAKNPFGPTDVSVSQKSHRYVFKLQVGFSRDQLVFETEYYVQLAGQ
ncbi:uncharacterized protein [Venturia canescens]|uniref:uncharacterized protein n=1 Tax=Venturia canescens TaxID=32260 RepID=UPI001C9BD62C|nr:uncharacterized protein LOC122417334 [Venturia canescens]